ncbi:MAG: hypothetical protein J1F67_06080 [Muribaculaceae bacterium]|nr:hypothetical protein [Muribaculaceae bacterium]
MKRLQFWEFIGSILIALTFTSCNDNDDVIWDYSPVIFEVLVENSQDENLLDENTAGNILGTEMYVIFENEKFDVTYGWPDDPYFPYPYSSRAYMPSWWGAFIAPYFYDYSDLHTRGNRLYIGEFFGDSYGETKFELYLDGHRYEISYTNKIPKPGKVDRHFFLDGKEIPSSNITLIL